MDIDLDFAREVVRAEAEAISGLSERIDQGFLGAARAMAECTGRVVTTGMGKAGIIAQKVAATLSSTGTSAIFMHPAEARHGDLGLVTADDVVLALSNSGETEDLVELVPPLRRIGAVLVVVTGSAGSSLADAADFVVDMGPVREPGVLGLAPTASTSAMLALGDALALVLKKAKGFDESHYSFYHGGGALSEKASDRRRLAKVRDLMRTGERVPVARPEAAIAETLDLVTEAHAGSVIVVDEGGKLLGIFTDGDLRRSLREHGDVSGRSVGELMTSPCLSIGVDQLLGDAQKIMQDRKVNELPVVDGEGRVMGLLDVQDVVNARPFR